MESRSFFSNGSPYLGHPLLTPERTALEIDRVQALTGSTNGPVIDIGCGFGRHLIELSRRGIPALGVDPSRTMIAAAHDRAAEAGVAVEAEVGTAVSLAAQPDKLGTFELALCLFTTLGQLDQTTIDAPRDAAMSLLEATAMLLRPGAALVIEVPDRERVVDALVVEEQLGPTQVRRSFDASTSIISESFVVGNTPPDAAKEAMQFDLHYLVFDRNELGAALVETGFVVDRVESSGLVEPPFTNMTLVARKQ